MLFCGYTWTSYLFRFIRNLIKRANNINHLQCLSMARGQWYFVGVLNIETGAPRYWRRNGVYTGMVHCSFSLCHLGEEIQIYKNQDLWNQSRDWRKGIPFKRNKIPWSCSKSWAVMWENCLNYNWNKMIRIKNMDHASSSWCRDQTNGSITKDSLIKIVPWTVEGTYNI